MAPSSRSKKKNADGIITNIGFDDHKKKTISNAEELVLNKFPEKVLELENILQSGIFSDEMKYELNIPIPTSEDIRKQPKDNGDEKQSKTRIFFPCGTVSVNEQISAMTDILKAKLHELLDDINLLRVWISFLTPRIEDGNNFGVEVQELVLDEILNVEDIIKARRQTITNYFVDRGDLVTKIDRYPHSEDYRRALSEMDEEMQHTCRTLITEMMNSYAILHDIFVKNLTKVKQPRNTANIHY